MTKTLKLPKKVVNANWKDDIDYEADQGEGTYIPPKKVDRKTLKRIKESPVRLAIHEILSKNFSS